MREWQETDIGKIPLSWAVTIIGNIAEIVTDGAHLSPKFYDGGKYMASVKDMTYDKFDFSDCKTISWHYLNSKNDIKIALMLVVQLY